MQLDGSLEFAREEFEHSLAYVVAMWSNSNPRAKYSFERQRLILQRRLGIGGHGDTPTLAGLGAELGLSAERVRQIQKQALDKLLKWNRHAGLSEWVVLCGYFPLDTVDEHLAQTALQLLGDRPTSIVPLWLNIAGHPKPRRTLILGLLRKALAERDLAEMAQRRAATAREQAGARLSSWLDDVEWPEGASEIITRASTCATRGVQKDRANAGSFESEKLGREVEYESGLERYVYLVLEQSAAVAVFQEQPCVIGYEIDGRRYDYYPDVLVELVDGRTVLCEIRHRSIWPSTSTR